MHKKIILLLFLIIILLLLSACSLAGARTEMLKSDDEEKQADERLDQVIEAIQNRDKDALRAIFSKQALEKAKDFDGSMDYLFDFFQGKVKSKEDDGQCVDESNDYGHDTKEVKTFYIVKTDKQKYLFFLLDCTVNTDRPDNIGLYTLRVIKEEDEDTQFSTWEEMKIPGIYKPKDNKDTGSTSVKKH